MFDANLAYYDGSPNKLIMVYIDSIHSNSHLFRAGGRKGKKYIARRLPPLELEGSQCWLSVKVGEHWVLTHNGIDSDMERLIFAGVAPFAPEMFTKETHPLNQTGNF